MISEEKAQKMGLEHHYGTLVTGIIPNTGADKAGLQLFDYLYGIDAYRAGEEQHFGYILKKYMAGDKAKLYFIRKGVAKTADITFGRRPEIKEEKKFNKCEDTFLGIASIADKVVHEIEGIQIKPVKNSTAMEIGMKDGDIIKSLNGYTMYDWEDIGYVLDNMKPGDAISVGWEREGKMMKASGKIKSFAETKGCKDCDCSELLEKEGKIIKIEIPDIDFEMPEVPKGPHLPAPAVRSDISNMTTEIRDVSAEEISKLNEKYDWRLETGNTLPVKNLQLNPNVSKGTFHLSFDLPQSGNTVVRIYNPLGRLIYDYDLGKFSGEFSDQVDISQNGSGTYILEIRQGEKTKAKKIVLKG